jgi:hypothetical protein
MLFTQYFGIMVLFSSAIDVAVVYPDAPLMWRNRGDLIPDLCSSESDNAHEMVRYMYRRYTEKITIIFSFSLKLATQLPFSLLKIKANSFLQKMTQSTIKGKK